MPEILEAPFTLYQNDPVISVADGTADTWTDIWKYQVPVGVSLILKPEHTFSAYLEDAAAEVGSATCSVRIEKKDASESDTQIVYGPNLYIASKEFQDAKILAHLNVPASGIIVNEREYLVVTVLDDGAIDESDSYFELRIAKVRKALGV